MGNALTTLAATILGGLVTLATVLVTQRGSRALQEREQIRDDRLRAEDQRREWQAGLLAARRSAYTGFNSSARTTRDSIKKCMHAYKAGGTLDAELRSELEQEWRSYVVQHAESHMIVSDVVLHQVGSVNGSLRVMYGMVKRLDQGGTPLPSDSIEALEARLEGLWERLEAMRAAMRDDLGVSDAATPPISGVSPSRIVI